MESTYKTTDIYLASTLCLLGYSLEEITYEHSKFTFHFTEQAYIDLDVDNYWGGELKVDPKLLFAEFKTLKGRMYDFKRSQERRST